ncbi:MAG TPA: hypothetical protein VNN80_14965, partial [Polyangiaceae bacterium]|nr:hypothetical protein [Polyangiaceae bacterium]
MTLNAAPSVSVTHAPGAPLPAPASDAAQRRRQRHRQRIRLLRQSVWALLFAGAALLTALSLRPQPVLVDLGRVEIGPLAVAIEESGRTRVKDRYAVSAPATGRLSRIWLSPGDAVQEGDTLAEIAPSLSPLIDERSRAEAEARLAAARSAAGQARTRIATAATARERAQRDVERTGTLVASGSLPRQALEDAEFALRTQLDEVASAEFAAKVAREEVRLAGVALGAEERGGPGRHVDVLAPASGRVLRVFTQSAGLVQAGVPLLEVGDPAVLEGVI